ncbi:MAG: hypothetical protein U1D55_08760 [Phycisphaerae bacterium]
MRLRTVIAILAGIFCAGCGANNLPADFTLTTVDVDRIVNDSTLTGAEKRDQLRAAGFSDTLINGLLRGDRTANQFGGTLRTAIEKVRDGQFAALTPDEVQLYGDAGAATGGPFTGSISDEAAAAVTQLFANQQFADKDQIKAFLDDPANEVSSAIPNNLLRQLFVDESPDDVQSQLP